MYHSYSSLPGGNVMIFMEIVLFIFMLSDFESDDLFLVVFPDGFIWGNRSGLFSNSRCSALEILE